MPSPPAAPARRALPLAPADADRSAELARLVHAHRDALARVARREGLRAEDALDAVQDAFLVVLAAPRALAPDPIIARRQLIAITRNLARNRRRLHAVARPHDHDPDAVATNSRPADDALAAAETRARLDVCLARLAERQRAVVLLRLLDGQGGTEVAAALGVSAAHVAVLLHRARASLCACLVEDVTAPK